MNIKSYLAGYLEKKADGEGSAGFPENPARFEGLRAPVSQLSVDSKSTSPEAIDAMTGGTAVKHEEIKKLVEKLKGSKAGKTPSGSLLGNLWKAYRALPLKGKIGVPVLGAGALGAAGIAGLGYFNKPKDVSQFLPVDSDEEENSGKLQEMLRKVKGLV